MIVGLIVLLAGAILIYLGLCGFLSRHPGWVKAGRFLLVLGAGPSLKKIDRLVQPTK